MIDNHLKKAEHNLKAVTDFRDIGYSDWSTSASFYALYHCLLALTLKFGFQSRNQSCTFAFVEDLINKKKISLEINDIKEIFDKEIEENLSHSDKILDIREFMQYSYTTSLDDEKFARLVERTKHLFNKIRKEIEKE
ncbi:MAG: HEPN domain-containing protein [Candidatus Aenigmarchaeota archaeon]|nr:HEPN domain-containing protein [Candidatus Aenigmarchaeota archaeon]